VTELLRPSRRQGVFAERHGFVLLDPVRLDEARPDGQGSDLLTEVLETSLGDELGRSGVAVPATGIDAGSYDLLVHSVDDPALPGQPLVTSTGWVLSTRGGLLLLGPLALLRRWDPYDLGWGWVTVPPGHYAVEVRGYPPAPLDHEPERPVDGCYAWALRRAAALPWFTADL
jgi:hypothetical protein